MANQQLPTSLAGGQVNINQPGDQPVYVPGQGGTVATQGQAPNIINQAAAAPASVAPAPPLSPAGTVQTALDQFQQRPVADPVAQVQDTLNAFESAGSAYMTNAARRGLEVAAARGLGNSSIAAGASQRAALESVQPFVQQAVQTQQQRENMDFQRTQNAINQALDLQKTREGTAFQGEQAQLDRDLRVKLQDDQAKQQDWLNSRSFSREFNSALSLLPIKSAFEMQSLVQQYALQNPETYPPSVVSGLTNFFQNNAMSILKQYFPNMVNVTGGG